MKTKVTKMCGQTPLVWPRLLSMLAFSFVCSMVVAEDTNICNETLAYQAYSNLLLRTTRRLAAAEIRIRTGDRLGSEIDYAKFPHGEAYKAGGAVRGINVEISAGITDIHRRAIADLIQRGSLHYRESRRLLDAPKYGAATWVSIRIIDEGSLTILSPDCAAPYRLILGDSSHVHIFDIYEDAPRNMRVSSREIINMFMPNSSEAAGGSAGGGSQSEGRLGVRTDVKGVSSSVLSELTESDIRKACIEHYGWEGIRVDPGTIPLVEVFGIESELIPKIFGPVKTYRVQYRGVGFPLIGPIMGSASCIVSNATIEFIDDEKDLSKHLSVIAPDEIDESTAAELAKILSQMLGLSLKKEMLTEKHPWILKNQDLNGATLKLDERDIAEFIPETVWPFSMVHLSNGAWNISFAAVSEFDCIAVRWCLKILPDGVIKIDKEGVYSLGHSF